jgi:hypothetical protein
MGQVLRARMEMMSAHDRERSKIHLISSMFAMHYAFETERSRWSFFHNIHEFIRPNGLFFGITFDGQRLFQALSKAPTGQIDFIARDGTQFASIRRGFGSQRKLPPFGAMIEFQYKGITPDGEWYPEYLVDFESMTQDLDDVYDLRLISTEEAQTLGLPDATGLLSAFENDGFQDLTDQEKAFSSLYRFFVFRRNGSGNLKRLTQLEHTILLPMKK